jgi:type VI secretion system protein ImpA
MSEELRQPPVIDLEVLLQPISDESPSGENLRYSGIYDEIAEARRADDNLNQGEWVTDLKVADYGKVLDLGIPALTTRTKDLQIGVWVSEAVTRKYGLAGFRDSLLLLFGLHDLFWETIHPEIDEGDMEGRANAMSWFDIQGALSLRTAPFTGGKGYDLNDFEDSKKYDFPENLDSLSDEERANVTKLKAESEKNRNVTASLWNVEKAETRRAAMETIYNTIEECVAALSDLNRIVEEKYERNQTPGFSNLKKTLDSIQEQAKKLLEEKRLEEPDEVEEEAAAEAGGETAAAGGAKADGSVSGAIANRKDALRRLAEIAAFFQKTEPHSPVSYLVQRAVKWGNMGLETWLQEVIKDQTVLFQLRETLGVDGGSDGGVAASDDPWAQ